MDLTGRTAVVVGLGASGLAAARLLATRGARVVATDSASRERLAPHAEALARLEAEGVTLALGGHDPGLFEVADLCVISPGVPSFPALEAFEASGHEVIGELELASRYIRGPIALIGGTNGKSTTTALVGAILGERAFVGGNFGVPLSDAVGADHDVFVVEISSFQAERVPTLHARVHALLNVTDDHLDRYPSFEAYARAKGNPFERMTADDVAVIPAGDEVVRRQAARGAARVVTFDPDPGASAVADVGAPGDAIVDRVHGATYPLALLRIAGKHNVSNACAAIAVAGALGVGESAIRTALAGFEGLGHRTARVAAAGGVTFYDDSKGTNVGASVAALRGLIEPKVVLIAGGRDKLGAYDPLVEALREKGRGLVVIGEAADRIAEAARGVLPVERAADMLEAVRRARALARPGDAVLLSPACSSFDMFRDYKDRGDAFVRAVRRLCDEEAS